MSSTPVFDAIARRAERPAPAPRTPDTATPPTAPAASGVPTPSIARATFAPASSPRMPAPVSPFCAPTGGSQSVHVPASLVAAIEAIPTRVVAAGVDHAVAPEQLALVEAVADAITRAVVDAVVTELEHIARDGVVRA